MEGTDRVNLQALFLEHASGHFTERALREQRVRILQYMVEHKYTMSDETFKELDGQLDGIEKQLKEYEDATPQN